MNKPVIKKEIKIDLNGVEIFIIGETHDQPIKHSETHGNIFSQVLIQNYRGETIHPGFSYPAAISDEELEHEVNFHARNIKEKPKAYGL